jgi:3-oxoacyl-ACP reductase-like protein
MEPTPGQRKAVFVLVVLGLAGLGVFLVRPGASGSAAPAHSPAASRAPAASPAAATQPPVTAPAPATPQPTATAPTGTAGIYQWLPFTPSELNRAAAVAVRFGDLYGTFSYTESATGYVQGMRHVITSQLSQVLARAYATPGLAGSRIREKQVSRGTSSISALRAFGSGSITFIVAIRQKITGTRGVSRSTGQYAVTVTGSGGSWQVSDIELASAGNA